MRHWSHIGIRNLRSRLGRSAGAVLAIALGVAIVVWVTSAYQSVHDTIEDQVISWVGSSQISVEPPNLGYIDEGFVDKVREVENVKVAAGRLKALCIFVPPGRDVQDKAPSTGWAYTDIIGIDPQVDYALHTFRIHDGHLGHTPREHFGRLLTADDLGGCMIEDGLAQRYHLNLGDEVQVANRSGSKITRLRIVGRFVLRRMSKFQRPTIVANLADVQQVKGASGKLSIIDVMLNQADVPAVRETAERIETLGAPENYIVHTTEARIRQLDTARDQTEFILMMISAVALLTSFFIVATTLSMSMVERLTHLGMMRCVGLSRRQMMAITFVEVLPIGILGTALGVPIGLALTGYTVSLAPEYIQDMVISQWGLRIAIIGGIATSILSGSIPALQASRISPLAATRPLSASPRVLLAAVAAGVGVLFITAHEIGLQHIPSRYFFDKSIVAAGAVSLFGGYALLTPLLALAGSNLFSGLAAAILRLRRRLLHHQIASTPWRSGTICSGFMVALSLVICVSIHSESVMAGWNFPTQIPESFIWMLQPLPADQFELVKNHPGIRDATALTNFMCYVGSKNKRGAAITRFPFSTFVGIEPEHFIDLTKMEFLEGNERDAREKMVRGGFVILPQEAALQMGLSLGDRAPIAVGNRVHTFEVAAVVKSPSLDIAAQYFQADSQLMQASGSSVLGSLKDAQEQFNVKSLTLVLANLDIEPTTGEVPGVFYDEAPPLSFSKREMADLLSRHIALMPQQQAAFAQWRDQLQDWMVAYDRWLAGRRGRVPQEPEELGPFIAALRIGRFNWYELTPQQRFDRFREQAILHQVKDAIKRPNAFSGSIRQLKEDIDRDIRQVLVVITTIPIVGLIIAAIGAGNLMMANVVVRIRQIAVLRAVGATQWQVVRLVLAEALILGLLGSVAGFALGLHAAHSINQVTFEVWGYLPVWTMPWNFVGVSLALTLLACLVAGLLPARYAARGNIIAAMSVT